MASHRFHPTKLRVLLLMAATMSLLAGLHGAALAQAAVVGILEGRATLLRPTGKLELAEGVLLREADIIETAPAAFAQIELADGVRIGVGESSRLMLMPEGAPTAANPARARLLQGWMKLTSGPDKPLAGDFITPRAAIGSLSGTCVVNADAAQFALFVENGSIAFTERGTGAPSRQMKAGDFLSGRSGSGLAASGRPAPEFVERMPRLFRDALPARAAKFRDRTVTPRALGEVNYDEIAAWLQLEEAIRVPMIGRWRVRLADKAFRDAVLAHLPQHPEWRPLVVPPKKPEPKPRIAEKPAERTPDRAREKTADRFVEPPAEPASAPP